jgi:hypothetical protein
VVIAQQKPRFFARERSRLTKLMSQPKISYWKFWVEIKFPQPARQQS